MSCATSERNGPEHVGVFVLERATTPSSTVIVSSQVGMKGVFTAAERT